MLKGAPDIQRALLMPLTNNMTSVHKKEVKLIKVSVKL